MSFVEICDKTHEIKVFHENFCKKKTVQILAICEILVYHNTEREKSLEEIMVSISKEQHLDMFLKMQLIRDVDMKLNKLVRRGFVPKTLQQ